MIYGIIALAALIHHIGKKPIQVESRTQNDMTDYMWFVYDETTFRLNEIDRIEIEIMELENDLKIKDDFSHLRKAAYKYEIQRLEDAKDRHNLRLDELIQ